MANIKPLVIKSGELQRLQTGDVLVNDAGTPYSTGGGGGDNNIDGGIASSVYLASQLVDGGGA